MATPLLARNIATEAPTAWAALESLVPFHAVDAEGHNVWRGLISTTAPLEELRGLTFLLQLWRGYYARGESPAEDFRESVRNAFPAGSCDRLFFEEELAKADSLAPGRFLEIEGRYLRREAKRASSEQASATYDLLKSALADLKQAQSRKRVILAGGDDPIKTAWLVQNAWRFLRAHCALVRLHERVIELVERRRAILEATCGSIADRRVQSDEHDDVA